MNFREAILKPAAAPAVPSPQPVKARQEALNVDHAKPLADRPKHPNQYSRIVISPCYGGYSVSETGIALYRQRYERKFKTPCLKTNRGYDISRQDPILVGIVVELGPAASTKYSKLEVHYFNSKYEGHVNVGEYDGFESAYVDVQGYKLKMIESITKSTSYSQKEKLKKITAVLEDACEDAHVFDSIPEGGFVPRA